MEMPIQLYALIWSNEDNQAIQAWQEEHAERVMITGWSRVLLEPLHKAVNDPNIFGMNIDGVVVRDHSLATPSALEETLKKLKSGTLKLYSVKNGLEPVTL